MENPSRKKLIQRYYSFRAKDYDRQKSRTWKSDKGFGNEVHSEMLSALEGFGNKNVLEVGVGTGRNAVPLLERIGPYLVGLDLSKEMLEAARKKMVHFRKNCDFVLGDAEHLPFQTRPFDAIVCMSTMHYFESQEKMLKIFKDVLRERGILVYGDLTIHESDRQGFFETLERILSKAHKRYCKPSEIEKMMKIHGFRVCRAKTIPYRKSYRALIEDKGEYFDVAPEILEKRIKEATMDAKKQYGLTDTKLTLFYTVIKALKEN